jgi:hypothetical protein
MFSPGRADKFQPEDAGPLQTLVDPAMEGSIPPEGRLNLLHQNLKSLSFLVWY